MCICQVVCLHWSTCPLRTSHSRMTVAVTMSANSHRPRSFVFAMHEEETRSAIIQYATRLPKSTYMRVTSDHVFCNAIPKLSETHLADACCTAKCTTTTKCNNRGSSSATLVAVMPALAWQRRSSAGARNARAEVWIAGCEFR